jgi:hypothetical protein
MRLSDGFVGFHSMQGWGGDSCNNDSNRSKGNKSDNALMGIIAINGDNN